MNRNSLPFRQIHLDFHTSEHIPGVGSAFDPDQFVHTLKEGNVNSVTLFAKCHHGWSYYPTEVGTPHPNLQVPDLLGDMISVCRKNNIQTPVYITVQWDEKSAREHPEWRVIRANHHSPIKRDWSIEEDADLNQMEAMWHPISVIHDDLVDGIIRQSKEVIERYDPEGLFLDILLPWQDVSPKNLERMAAKGLNPEKEADRLANDRGVIMEYYEKYGQAIREVSKSTRIFHNSGHIYKGERERWEHFTHLELESLPTGGWGYDHFPLSARYTTQIGKEFLGMTGKFHTMWGEFGGYKTSVALEYECAQMVALGARCSIGDQLHPCGALDSATYKIIGPAYKRVETLEPYLEGALPVATIGILSAEAHHNDRQYESVDIGAARVLLESQQMFDLLDWDCDFSQYEILLLPDVITLNEAQKECLEAYLNSGGKILSTGDSVLTESGDEFALNMAAKVDGERVFNPDYILAGEQLKGPFNMVESPFVSYKRGKALRPDGAEVLAQLHDPYFNRSWQKFCSHQHTPYEMEPNQELAAVIRHGNVIHFAHPLFHEYYQSGQPLTKSLLLNALRLLQTESVLESNLPSSARISWMRQEALNRDVFHMIYAQTQLRGSEVSGWGGAQSIEILEDAVPLHDVVVKVPSDKPVNKMYSAYSPDVEIPVEKDENGKYVLSLGKLYIHDAFIMEYA